MLTCPEATRFKTQPDTRLYSDDSNRYDKLKLSAVAQGMYNGSLRLMPGHYTVSAQDGFCEGGARITVLPGRDRKIGMVLRQGRVIFGSHSYVAGTLPINGFARAFLTGISGDQHDLTLDGGAYYGENLPPGQYILTLAFFNSDLSCRIPVTIGDNGTIRNLLPSDITHSIGRTIRYFGKPDQFELLWPNTIH